MVLAALDFESLAHTLLFLTFTGESKRADRLIGLNIRLFIRLYHQNNRRFNLSKFIKTSLAKAIQTVITFLTDTM